LSSRFPDRARHGRHGAPLGRTSVALAALALAAIAHAFLAAGCADRPRSNPLDPLNPDTGGGPATFTAVAQNGQVDLRWTRAPARADLLGFLLERRRTGPNEFVRLGPILPPQSTGSLDVSVVNDLDYEYRLTYVDFDTSAIGASVTSIARPGPEVGWVADPGADEIVRLTPDTRQREHTITSVRTANRISVERGNGRVWATEPFNGSAKAWAPDGSNLTFFPVGVTPNAISAVDGANLAWICDEGTGRVARFTIGGTQQFEAGTFELPTDVVATSDGGAWMVDEETGMLYRFNHLGQTVSSVDVGSDPRRLALDEADQSVWVTCYTPGEVVHVSAAGEIAARYAGFDRPYGIDVDESRHRVWIGLDVANTVRAISSTDGSIVFDVTGIARPRGLAVAGRTGECWVAAVASGEVVRIGVAGTVAVRRNGFNAPLDVRVVEAGSISPLASDAGTRPR
jgi:streptogramin lyase